MFYQNLFDSFTGVLVLSDRQYSMNFKIAGNVNQSNTMMAWNLEPYNLTGNATLTLNYSFDYKNYAALAIDVTTTAANVAAVNAYEIAAALNANATFQSLYLASVQQGKDPAKGAGGVQGLSNYLGIKCTRSSSHANQLRTYISNTGAEQALRFNKKAGVAELPSYFARHTISNANNYTDSVGMLIQLSNPVTGFDQTIVSDAGLNYNVVQADYQLLHGRSGLFNFQKITVDGSNRITRIIEFPAGAVAGDLGRQIDYVFTGSNTNPSQITEIPHVVVSGDLVTPP